MKHLVDSGRSESGFSWSSARLLMLFFRANFKGAACPTQAMRLRYYCMGCAITNFIFNFLLWHLEPSSDTGSFAPTKYLQQSPICCGTCTLFRIFSDLHHHQLTGIPSFQGSNQRPISCTFLRFDARRPRLFPFELTTWLWWRAFTSRLYSPELTS